MRALFAGAALLALTACATAPQAPAPSYPPIASVDEFLAATPAADWRALDPENTLYIDLPTGRVIIELAPAFAPNHVANVKALVREHYFDGAYVIRSQDNYVVQWGHPDEAPRAIQNAQETLPAEFDRAASPDLQFTALPDRDTYAPEVGFSNGFPAARGDGRAWLTHCYAMVGAGRDVAAESGGGTSDYVVIGQSPRNLDRNVTLFGRVVQGVELLSVMPRGTGALGFYETREQMTQIPRMRIAADVPEAERTNLEALRTDTDSFAALVESRRNRRDEWYKNMAGAIGVCNAPLPVRLRAAP